MKFEVGKMYKTRDGKKAMCVDVTQYIITFMMALTMGATLVFAATVGLDREIARQEAVQEHNCKYYGDAINRYYGREVCPLDERG